MLTVLDGIQFLSSFLTLTQITAFIWKEQRTVREWLLPNSAATLETFLPNLLATKALDKR